MEDLTAFSSGSREKGGDTGQPKVQGWVGSGMCVLEDASQAWWLVGGKFSPLQCSLSTRHIL